MARNQVKCETCKELISSSAKFCPYCGRRTEFLGQSPQVLVKNEQTALFGLETALKDLRCELSLAEFLSALGVSAKDVLHWTQAKRLESGEQDKEIPGIFFLFENELVFVSRAFWPGKLSAEKINNEKIIIPLSGIKRIKLAKGLLGGKIKKMIVRGRISKKTLLGRKEFKRGREVFSSPTIAALAKKASSLNPEIELR